MINPIYLELTRFNFMRFDDASHSYYDELGKPYIGSTKFFKPYKKPFNKWPIATATGKRDNKTAQEVMKEWEAIRHAGTDFHSYAENALSQKMEYPLIPQNFISMFRKLYWSFIKTNSWIPIKQEMIIGYPKYRVAGTVDSLIYSYLDGGYILVDWKTNRSFNFEGGSKMYEPLTHLKDNKLTVYNLQLSLYRYIIEQMTDIDIRASYIVWFDLKENKYHPIKTTYLKDEIISVLAERENGTWDEKYKEHQEKNNKYNRRK